MQLPLLSSQLAQSQDSLQAARARISSLEDSLQTIQPAYQSALNDRGLAAALAEKSRASEEAALAKVSAMLTKIAGITAELEAYRQRDKDSLAENPDDPLAMARREVELAKKDTERATRNATRAEELVGFMRQQYNEATSRVMEQSKEIQGLQDANEKLRFRAAENAVRIHEVNRDQAIRILEEEKEELRMTVGQRNFEVAELRERVRALERDKGSRRTPRGGGNMGFGSPSGMSSPATRSPRLVSDARLPGVNAPAALSSTGGGSEWKSPAVERHVYSRVADARR